MTITSKEHRTIKTKGSDMPGTGKLTGDQTDLLAGITTSLHGLGYPAMKDDILKQAQKNGADPTVISSIKNVSERHYTSSDDLLKEFDESR
ncbi:DUF2795 domain-containing protein [Desulfovibrio gilichinskyi]|uniref:DUF2795 domain-containing protein n=1 Tax=Desulfovibrio gilichinskyi TaxID=1519643 RepID=A0A1X7EXH8_9BACT|nr:DUF2795 domain-containing protein [Desulfovibrio gilichinskyi]SMF41894.1 Protein of unknown function [Desulfovibrio gilichinskyi]